MIGQWERLQRSVQKLRIRRYLQGWTARIVVFSPNDTVTPRRTTNYQFATVTYELELVAKIMNRSSHLSLWKITLEVPAGTFDPCLVSPDTEIVFN